MGNIGRRIASGFVAIALCSTPAMGQNALGSGHALDANTRRGSGGLNSSAPSVVSRLGRAAPRSFGRTFDLTSDAAFRHHNIQNVGGQLLTESLYNNPWYWQNVGSLYTEMLTGGSGSPSALAGMQQGFNNPFFYDQWETPTGRMQLGAVQQLVGLPSTLDEQRERIAPGKPGNLLQVPMRNSMFLQDDRLGSMIRSGRDHWRRGASTVVAGRGMSAEKRSMRHTMSYMRGIGRIAGGTSPNDIGLDDWDTSRLSSDQMSARRIEPPGQPWSTRFARLTMTAGRMQPDRVNGSVPGLLRPVMQSIADRYTTIRPRGTADEAMKALDHDYARIRSALLQSGHEPLDELLAFLDDEAAARAATGDAGSSTGDEVDTTLIPGLEPGTLEPMTALDFGMILIHGQQIESLSMGDHSRFDDLVAAGEQALREGEYLRADRRFTRALRFIPGQPLATVGLISSQVGAGLYLSAALTLKSLLVFQPEMIDARLNEALLPRPQELDRTISILTGRLQKDEDLHRYGLILAWIGHQLDRDHLVQSGLDAMRRSGRESVFTSLLEQIWTADDAASGADERVPMDADESAAPVRLTPIP